MYNKEMQRKKNHAKEEQRPDFEITSHVHFKSWSPILAYRYMNMFFNVDATYARICGLRYQILPVSIHIMISHMSTHGILKSKYNTQPYLVIEPVAEPGTILIFMNDPHRINAWRNVSNLTQIICTQDLPQIKNSILFATHGLYEHTDGTSLEIKDVIKDFKEIYYIKPYTEQTGTITHVCSVRPDPRESETIVVSTHKRRDSNLCTSKIQRNTEHIQEHTKCMYIHFSTYELVYMQFWRSELKILDTDLLVRMADCHFHNDIAMRACAWKLFALDIPYNNSRANVCGGVILRPDCEKSKIRVLSKYQDIPVLGTKMIMFSVRCDSERI
jgi:hypothetical protein